MPRLTHQTKPAQLLSSSRRLSKSVLAVFMAVLVVSGGYIVARSFAATNQLYLTPSSGTVLSGNNVDVQVRVNSGTDPVNAVQANLSYDPAKLQFVSVSTTGSAFPLEAQSTGGSGSVNMARAVNGGSAPATGDQLFATVTFKALVSSTTANINIAAGSAVVRSTDNSNILVDSAGATFTLGSASTPTPTATPTPTPTPTNTPTPTPGSTPSPTPTPGAASATMSINPDTGNVTDGQNLVFDINEDSGTAPVNAVQANFDYDTTQWDFVSIGADKSAFGLQAQASGAGGHILIARGVNGGSAALTGSHNVATVTLRAKGTGSAAVTVAAGSAVVSSDTNANILTTKTGGTYTLSGSGSPTPTPVSGGGSTPTPNPTPAPTPAPVPVSVTGSKTPVPVKGTITVETPALPDNGNTTVAVDGKTQDTPVIDTTQLTDGNHTVTATSTNSDGTKSSTSQKITVENKSQPTSFAAVLSAAKPALPFAAAAAALLIIGIVGTAFYRHAQGPTVHGGSDGGTVNSNDLT
jgi:hypothetical protein